jgi:hypothetical protein
MGTLLLACSLLGASCASEPGLPRADLELGPSGPALPCHDGDDALRRQPLAGTTSA